ncbi:hypothetical protein Tco_1418482 [Tanacetum coccineum]
MQKGKKSAMTDPSNRRSKKRLIEKREKLQASMDEPQGPHIRILIIFKVSLLSVNRIPSLIGSADSHQITALDDGVMKQDGANKEEGRAVNIFKDETIIQFLNQVQFLHDKLFMFLSNLRLNSSLLSVSIQASVAAAVDMHDRSGQEHQNLHTDTLHHPCIMLGDFSVTLNTFEHSVRGSSRTTDMQEFNNSINFLEIEDVCRSALWKNGNFHEKVVKLKDALKQAQRDVDAFTLNLQVKIIETFCLKEYQEAVNDEEKLMFQQANVNWLLRMANQLRELKKLNNSLIIILGHSSKCFLIDDIATLFTNKVTSDEAEYIIRDVYDNEIKEVAFDIRDCKAPELDGYTSTFFKKAWIVVGNESAFIPGRNIYDNILLAQELLRRYNKKSCAKRLAMKIDIAKAYDIVDWHGYLKGGRGLRQGDPLSPYLFTLVMKVFTLIIVRKVKECKDFKYHLRCKDLSLTHMCFVDDLLVICHRDVKYVKLRVRYLGVPLLTKEMGVNDCKNLVDRIKTRCMSSLVFQFESLKDLQLQPFRSLEDWEIETFVSLLEGLQGGKRLLYVKRNKAISLGKVAGDGVAGIKRRCRDLSCDGVKNFATASGRGRLKEDLESST